MNSFLCCIWWFVFGVLVGWLLSWFFGRRAGGRDNGGSSASRIYTTPVPAPAPPVAAYLPPAAPVMDPKIGMIAAAAAAGVIVRGADDLEIIEGIGPKIAAVLKDGGVNSFAKLADASIPAITAILHQAGPHFILANPASWAEQAQLAASGKWHELKKLQDVLIAGVRKRDDHQA